MEPIADYWKKAGAEGLEIRSLPSGPSVRNDMEALVRRIRRQRKISRFALLVFLSAWIAGWEHPVIRWSLGLTVLLFASLALLTEWHSREIVLPSFDGSPAATLQRLMDAASKLSRTGRRWLLWSAPALVLGGFVTGLAIGAKNPDKLISTGLIAAIIGTTYLVLVGVAYAVVRRVFRRPDALMSRLKSRLEEMKALSRTS